MKVLIVGWDGADWNIVNQLIERGQMPNLEGVVNNGGCCDLISTRPSISPVAWTSFSTGMKPCNHNVFSFARRDGSEFLPLTSLDIDCGTIWNILSEKGYRSVVVNVPMTYPPEKIRGKMISGFLSPEDSNYTYPEDLKQKIESDGYVVEAIAEDGFNENKKEKMVEEIEEAVENRTNVFLELLGNEEWTFSTIVYTGLDRIQHYFWKYMEDNNSDYKEVIHEHYRKLDEELGKIVGSIDKDTKVIVMSDHGFTSMEGEFYMNNWLREEGYVELKDESLLEKLGFTQQNLINIFRKLGIHRFLLKIKDILNLSLDSSLPRPKLDKIDFQSSEAYAYNFGGLIDITCEENKEQIREDIIQKLRKLEDPEGNKVFEEVISYVDICEGKINDDVPDILTVSKDWEPVGYLGYKGLFSKNSKKSGKHRSVGVFATNFSFDKHNVKLFDVLPTIIDLLDLDIDVESDGKSIID